MADVKFIVTGPAEFAEAALAELMSRREMLDRCEPGYGWRFYGGRWTAFMRKTKTGYSSVVSHHKRPANPPQPHKEEGG